MKKFYYYVTLLLLLPVFATAQDSAGEGHSEDSTSVDFYAMSLEDLMNIEVQTASLVDIKKMNVPVSLTTITREDIENSPYLSMYDLLEVYVPGFVYTSHGESNMMGIRGIIADRNHKYLVVVNGYNLTQKSHAGVVSEVGSIDLTEIETIEIIRGPGSVTYGAGAMAGVINITTRSGKTYNGLNATVSGGSMGTKFADYNAWTAAIQGGKEFGDFNVYAYFSASDQDGGPDGMYVTKTQGGDNGTEMVFGEYGDLYNTTPSHLRQNFVNRPLLKGQIDAGYKNVRFWARYTEQVVSSPLSGYSKYQTGFDDDGAAIFDTVSLKGLFTQQISGSISNKFDLSDKFSVTAKLNAFSLNFAKYPTTTFKYDENSDPEYIEMGKDYRHPVFARQIFAENDIQGQLIGKLKANDKFSVAGGLEYTINSVGAPWGYDATHMRLGDGARMISDSVNSIYIKHNKAKINNSVFVGDGWTTQTLSVLGESNLQFSKYAQMLVSFRMDKNTYSDLLFSPRIALVSEVTEKDVVKVIAQQSARFSTGEQMYEYNAKDSIASPEKLQGVELIYNRLQNENLSASFAGFYNSTTLLGWNTKEESTTLVSDQTIAGADLEVTYKTETLIVSVNHSFAKQIDNVRYEESPISPYSYNDANKEVTAKNYNGVDKETILFTGYGNNFTNMPNHTTKLFATARLMDKKLTLHANTRVSWKYQGMLDKLEMYVQDSKGKSTETEVNKIVQEIKDAGVYGTNFTLSLSAKYQLMKNLDFKLSAMNLLKVNANRYTHDWGMVKEYPQFVKYYVEPTVIKATLKFTI